MAADFAVVAIHPNVIKASRPRYRAAGGRSDPGDAYIVADVVRTDGHRFATLQPLSDEIKALRALVRTRADLVRQRVALANQLRALLESFWPGAVMIFAEIDSAIALAFLDRYPTPRSAARLGTKRLEAFLSSQSYPGRRSADELLARLRSAPVPVAEEAEAATKGELVGSLVAVLRSVLEQLQRLTGLLETKVEALPDGQILMSFPRAGRVNAAQILAELGDDRARFQTEHHLAAEAGVAPVTHASGKSRAVAWRWACNKRLRLAVTTSPTIRDTNRLGPRMSIVAHELGAPTIHTRLGCSLGLGFACSGGRGRIGNRTMLRNIALLSRWRQRGLDTERLNSSSVGQPVARHSPQQGRSQMSKGIATAAAVSFLLTACDSSPTPEHVEHGLSEFFERAKWVNTLPPPPNASASKVGGGSTSGEREHFEFVVETTLSPEQVRDHYVGQLESRGWQASQRLQEGALALQTFHFVDESSTKWQGVLQTAANASQSDRVVVHLSLNRVPEATVQ